MCVFHIHATELSLLPYHSEFQSCGRDELVWNKLAVLTAQTAPALGYKLKQKQPYLHISASSPWNTIRSASIFNVQQTERLPSSCPTLLSSYCCPKAMPDIGQLLQVFQETPEDVSHAWTRVYSTATPRHSNFDELWAVNYRWSDRVPFLSCFIFISEEVKHCEKSRLLSSHLCHLIKITQTLHCSDAWNDNATDKNADLILDCITQVNLKGLLMEFHSVSERKPMAAWKNEYKYSQFLHTLAPVSKRCHCMKWI